MDKATVGMQGGMTKRTMQQVTAMMVALLMLLTTGAQATIPTLDLGKQVSILLSKLSPSDTTPEKAVERLGGKVGRPIGLIDGFEATVPEKALPQLAATPGVRGVSRNSKVTVEAAYGENSYVASSVYMDVTRASKAWGQGITGKGVTVALIDTGVDIRGDLAGRVVGAADFSGENNPHLDSYGHGTFVAGLIAGTGAGNSLIKGVAPEANIFSVKIAGRDGSTDLFKLLAALEFVAIHKDAFNIRVLNLSLGTDSTQSYKVDPLNFAVERVWNSGIAVVVAAGNGGKILKPADDPLVITVGAVDDKTTAWRTDDALASFSGVGPTLSDGLAKPDVIASGRSVVSSRSVGSTIEANFPNAIIGDRYFKGSGTSFSSAIVAGAAALVVQKTWSLNPNQIKQRIVSAGKPISTASHIQQGSGSLDAFNAMVSSDTTAANQGVVLASGGGSFQASTGSACFRDAVTGVCITEEELMKYSQFNTSAYYGNSWGGSAWNGSAWNGSAWNGSAWNGSAWNGSAWNGSAWNGSAWNGSAWNGSAWNGSTWDGTAWAGSAWNGTVFGGSAWNGSAWNGSAWNGSAWNGSAWNGSAWNGSTWDGSAWNGSAWNGSAWSGSAWNGSAWLGLGQGEIQWLGSHWQ